MSQWKFNNSEFEIDVTDADFLDKVEEAGNFADTEQKKVRKVGKTSDIIREQCSVFYRYFDMVLGSGSGEKIFAGKSSIALCNQAVDSFIGFIAADINHAKESSNALMNKYKPNKPQQNSKPYYYHGNKKH